VGKNVWEDINERTVERGFRGSFTLEWMIDSPPNFHTFEEIPQIRDVKNGAAYDFVRHNPGAFPL
jgi:heme/copper-type cytochrome/quinol oxidase subunit 1